MSQIYTKIVVTPEQAKQLKKGGVGIYVCTPGHKFYITCKNRAKDNIKLKALLLKKQALEKKIRQAMGVKRIHSTKVCSVCKKNCKNLGLHMRFKHEGVPSPISGYNKMRKPMMEALHGTDSRS